nr:MAG TPA: hypothetical protein [Caudoviricetes sp.]
MNIQFSKSCFQSKVTEILEAYCRSMIKTTA